MKHITTIKVQQILPTIITEPRRDFAWFTAFYFSALKPGPDT